MSNVVIRAELESRLKTWADAQVPKITISFENQPFTKPTTGMFMECFLLPSVTLNPELSANRSRKYGLFQVNCWTQSGKGMKAVEQLAQSVANLFPVVPKTGSVSIESTPHIENSMLDTSGWIVVPVVIQYRYEA